MQAVLLKQEERIEILRERNDALSRRQNVSDAERAKARPSHSPRLLPRPHPCPLPCPHDAQPEPEL